ncbi:hypothetical protein F511_38825 [Dorcoceras hygrometricum]|uniref:Uncharacterized protein n=1 Tax=Dorcoceras hygrometricum TaxID=472368 RepID=A0A2Z7A4Y5_9LAMI|nr:hypothetical protein F511_38825 [Dorcoceras hygrometricum]
MDDPDPTNVDLREEYANAFRTESYNEFWMRVLSLDKGSAGSTTADRLPSYRMFVEQLLDPDQLAVDRILGLTQTRKYNFSLYFSVTADASHLCGLLLKDLDHIRKDYQPVKNGPCMPTNPFGSSAPSSTNFRAVQAECYSLLTQLESRRKETRSRIRLKKFKCGSAVVILVALAALIVLVAAHAFGALVAAPGIIAASFELISVVELSRLSAQLDASAKGTYILIRELDTISRLVARLNNELERFDALMRLWLGRGNDRLQASGEVASHLQKNEQVFIDQMDELEEHLYLGFVTINRARNLVIKEILKMGP